MFVGSNGADPSFPFKNPKRFHLLILLWKSSPRWLLAHYQDSNFPGGLGLALQRCPSVSWSWWPQVSFSFPGFSPPWGLCPLLQELPSSLGISPVLGWVASLLVTDEALVVIHVLSSISGGEIDSVDVHSIGVPSRVSGFCHLGLWDVAVPATSELPDVGDYILDVVVQPLLT